MQKRKKVFLMISDGGGGHRATANSLKSTIEKMGLPWDVRIVNPFIEILNKEDPFWKMSKTSYEDVYNAMMKYNVTYLVSPARRVANFLIKFFTPKEVSLVRKYMINEKPDFVLSIMPFINDILAKSLNGTNIPIALLMSDLMDTKPMWLTPEICKRARFIAVGCQEAAEQYEGKDKSKIITSGLVIHSKHFNNAVRNMSKEQARKYFKLDENLFTLMITTGGYGMSVIGKFIKHLEKTKNKIQIIACCGKNEKLLNEIKSEIPEYKNKILLQGFTTELHLLMKAADVVLTKPGPASIMEAVAVHRPLIVFNSFTMPQEVPNVKWVKKNKFGMILNKPSQLLKLVENSNKKKLTDIEKRMKKYELEDANPIIVNLIKKNLKT